MEQSVQFFQYFEKDLMIDTAKKATKKMFAEYIEKENKVKEQTLISEKGRRLVDIVKTSDFGCKRESIIKLCEVITGEKLIEFYKREDDNLSCEFEYELFACFVVKKEMDSFSVDDVLIVVNTSGFVFTYEGLEANDLEDYCEEEFDNDYVNAHYVRPATDEEIETFIEKIYPLLQR